MPANEPAIVGAPSSLLPRTVAFALDYIIIAAYLLAIVAPLSLAGNYFVPDVVAAVFGTPLSGQLMGFVLVTLPVTLYFAMQEAGPAQATWGKRRAGLHVGTVDGGRMTFTRSLGRTVLKFVPWELAHTCIWHVSVTNEPPSSIFWAGITLVWVLVGANVISVATSKRRQALYDRVAGTMVAGNKPW